MWCLSSLLKHNFLPSHTFLFFCGSLTIKCSLSYNQSYSREVLLIPFLFCIKSWHTVDIPSVFWKNNFAGQHSEPEESNLPKFVNLCKLQNNHLCFVVKLFMWICMWQWLNLLQSLMLKIPENLYWCIHRGNNLIKCIFLEALLYNTYS